MAENKPSGGIDFESFLSDVVKEEENYNNLKNQMAEEQKQILANKESRKNSSADRDEMFNNLLSNGLDYTKKLEEAEKASKPDVVEEVVSSEKPLSPISTKTEELIIGDVPATEEVFDDVLEIKETTYDNTELEDTTEESQEMILSLEKEDENTPLTEESIEEVDEEIVEEIEEPDELGNKDVLNEIFSIANRQEEIQKQQQEEAESKRKQEAEEKISESIISIYETFNEEQMAYINSVEDKNQLVARPDLGIHFHQIQDPLCISNNIQLNKALEEEKRAEEARLAKEAEEAARRAEQEALEAATSFEDLDETIEEQRARQKRIKKAVRRKERKIPDKYPKEYFDPTDMEIDENDQKEYYYFNIEKTLRKANALWITKAIPLYKLDWMDDSPIFDKIAQRQHEKAVKLNAMEAEDQYDRDIRNKIIQIGCIAAVVGAIACHVIFNVIPQNKFNDAYELMKSKQYEASYTQFMELEEYNFSFVYAKYCEGQGYYQRGDYDKAKDCFTKLEAYQDKFESNVNIPEMITDCDYQKALVIYSNHDYETAKNIFKGIYKYSDATEYYYKCCYAIADSYYEEKDYFKAIDNFYEISKVEYSDSKERLLDIASQLYEDATSAYKRNEYDAALENFTFLASYSYQDSKSMVNQCSYKNGLILCNEGNYESARKCFEADKTYKDSLAMYKECTYNIGKQAYSKNPVSSIKIFETIKGFKDAQDIMESNELVLYGRWKITGLNGESISPIEFSFYDGGILKTDKQIVGVAISTEATPYNYKWNGSHFSVISDEQEYTINIIKNDVSTVIIECATPDTMQQYTCERVYEYTEMLEADNTVVTEEEDTELTLNQKIEREVEAFIDKKVDGFVNIGGELVEVNGAKAKLQGALSQETEAENTSAETENTPSE